MVRYNENINNGKEVIKMTKIKTDMKRISNGYRKVFRCGYCDLQDIYKYETPQFYNCGVYGWNCDIYVDYKRDIAITTGYRNMRGKQIPYDLIKKYSEFAKEISNQPFSKPYEEIKAALDENKEKFLDELENL